MDYLPWVLVYLLCVVVIFQLPIVASFLSSLIKEKSAPQQVHSAEVLPFSSYREFLEARESMDVDQFLARAFQTPENLKRPPVESVPQVSGGQFSDLTGLAGFTMMNGGAGGDIFNPIANIIQKGPESFKLKVGAWYRNDGVLEKLIELPPFKDGVGLLEPLNSGYRRAGRISGEVAIPKPSESWMRRKCESHPPIADEAKFFGDSSEMVIYFGYEPVGLAIERHQVMNLCGCLMPIQG